MPDRTTIGHPFGLRPDSHSEIRNGLTRTNERTDEEIGSDFNQVTLVDARRAGDDIAVLGEVVRAGTWTVTGERHPVVRWGERDEIPGHVRLAVMYRDRFQCQLCLQGYQRAEVPLHIDHIKPWSAGGSDRSENLRVLCETHNMERGNKVIPEERPASPVTWWCLRCYSPSDEPWDYSGPVPACPIHFGGREYANCRVIKQYVRALKLEQPLNWHQRPEIELADATLTAYCAHCNLRGLTDVTL